jgi:hypothetical protein
MLTIINMYDSLLHILVHLEDYFDLIIADLINKSSVNLFQNW